MNRWLIGALVLSLIANLLLIGFVAGRSFGPQLGPPPPGIFWMVQALPREERARIRPVLREHMPRIVREARSTDAARNRVAQLLSGRELSAQELDAHLEALRAQMDGLNAATLQAMRHVALELEQEQRHQVAAALRGERGHREHHRPRHLHRERMRLTRPSSPPDSQPE